MVDPETASSEVNSRLRHILTRDRIGCFQLSQNTDIQWLQCPRFLLLAEASAAHTCSIFITPAMRPICNDRG